ncbi:GtrA family protein [Haematomicrobium sanguinis]|uniref:GtrA family protein n=1 Tax=Haematomicrobium sanguinis TaxID=479106 RepID=UPI00068C464B|nr:GtrA family protein [Haematomicrobium sanguinis]
MLTRITTKLQNLASLFWRELAKFGVIGGIAFIIDSGLTWWLFHGPMSDSEVKAKVVATLVATIFAWFGNRYWTFRHRKRNNALREGLMFALMNGVGLAIAAGCVGLAKYVFNINDKFWLFVAGNIVGVALGTIFRWFAYRFWVFNEEMDQDPAFAGDHELFEGQEGADHVQPVAAGKPGDQVPTTTGPLPSQQP